MSIQSEKSALRKKFLAIRSQISNEQQRSAEQQITENFLKNIEIKDTDIVSAYYPVNGEVSPLTILQKLDNPTALPIIAQPNAPLKFAAWKNGDELVTSRFYNIHEPAPYADKLIPTILIVPLVAFDKNCNRLGYGGGFFDRTIQMLKDNECKITTIGLAHSCQQADEIPVDEFDMSLDFVITEERVWSLESGVWKLETGN